MKKFIKLYTEFRKELDKMCIPLILDELKVEPITYNGKTVGMIANTYDYIDCVYIKPRYRRKGLAKKSVERLIKGRNMRLHIINNNTVAYKFWNDNFYLEKISSNNVDTLYWVRGVKDDKSRKTKTIG